MSETIEMDVAVRKVETVHRRREEEDKNISRAVLKDEAGSVGAILTGPNGKFDHFTPGQIVKVTITDPQTKLG